MKNQDFTFKMYKKSKIYRSKRLEKIIQKEISLLTELSHENIAKLFEIIECRKYLILVLDISEGMTMKKALSMQKKQRFAEEDAKKIFRDIVEGVNYLHENNIAHRNLKLDNIIVGEN